MPVTSTPQDAIAIGQALRARRKALGTSMVAAAEAASISRVTWHRLEKGEATVALGSLLAAAQVLGLRVMADDAEAVSPATSHPPDECLPLRTRLEDYPQLRRLAWQVADTTTTLTPREAFGVYQRNWRHLDVAALQAAERALIHALRETFGGEWPGV